jgi:hypothetical protein
MIKLLNLLDCKMSKQKNLISKSIEMLTLIADDYRPNKELLSAIKEALHDCEYQRKTKLIGFLNEISPNRPFRLGHCF